MKIVALNESLEEAFWNYVNQDPLHYYFFIVDWQQRRDRTKILLAMEADKVEGMALFYAGYSSAQGNPQSRRILGQPR